MNGQELIEQLRQTRPDVAIRIDREIDDMYVWDGYGPDPTEDGFDAYDVDVVAMAIRRGEILEGRSSLGGSYFKLDEPVGEVHGYLPQMVKEAIEELDKLL